MIQRAMVVMSRATPGPLLVRVGVFAAALAGITVAFPPEVLAGYFLGLLVVLAALAAALPRSPWVTVTALVTVVGWLASTVWYDEPVALWRLIALASFLYLTHSLAALAALLPYDAVVPVGVVGHWLSRALAVVLGSAVLAILVLTAADRAGDRAFLAAALGGLAVALALTALLTRLLRRE
jgi:hypothetical protein